MSAILPLVPYAAAAAQRSRGSVVPGLRTLGETVEPFPTARPAVAARAASPEAVPIVLAVGLAAEAAQRLRSALAPGAEVVTAATAGEALDLLERTAPAVVCVGEGVAGAAAAALVDEAAGRRPDFDAAVLVLAAGGRPEPFQALVDADRFFYLSRRPPAAEDLVRLVAAALAPRPEDDEAADAIAADDAGAFDRVLAAAAGVAAAVSLPAAAAELARAAAELVPLERADLLLVDRATDTLWNPAPGLRETPRQSAAVGLAAYVARTGAAASVPCAAADPRFDPEADDPGGAADDRLLALPVPGRAGRGALGVLIAVRRAAAPPFDAAERRRLAWLAEQSGPLLARRELAARLEAQSARVHGVGGSEAGRLYRDPALEAHLRAPGAGGRPIRMSPRWLDWAFAVVAASALAAGAFAALTTLDRYAGGPAVVRLEDGAPPRALAALPARFRPAVTPGATLLLALDGTGAAPLALTIEEVGEVTAAAAARERFGAAGDAVALAGPVFVVAAPLPSRETSAPAGPVALYDGLTGRAEVKVGSERLLFSVLSILRGGRDGG